MAMRSGRDKTAAGREHHTRLASLLCVMRPQSFSAAAGAVAEDLVASRPAHAHPCGCARCTSMGSRQPWGTFAELVGPLDSGCAVLPGVHAVRPPARGAGCQRHLCQAGACRRDVKLRERTAAKHGSVSMDHLSGA